MTVEPVLDLSSGPRRVHLLGIGGAGMSAIAMVLHALGHRVSGSDAAESPALNRLRDAGIAVHVGHDATHVADAEIVGVSTAIREDNPELIEARRLDLSVHHRYDLLGAIGTLRRTLSVSGTHGKTTTSALLTLALDAAGLDPSFIIGGLVAPFDVGSRWTDGEWFVLEADESDSTFLAPPRRGCIVTNIEADHLDHHGSFDALCAAFETFVVETDGPAVICGDDAHSARLAGVSPRVVTYGRDPGCDAVISDVVAGPAGTSWVLTWRGARHQVDIALPGDHLVLNATAALVLAGAVGVDIDAAVPGVAAYQGVGRRYESRGRVAGIDLVDDYAHLPTEVAAVLGAARQSAPRRIVAVFQPHRYSRTEEHHRDYAAAFAEADVVVVTEIYAAGEDPIEGVDGRLVHAAVAAAQPQRSVVWAPEREDLLRVLEDLLREGDLCITMGAGDLTTLPDELRDVLSASGGDRGGR